MRISFSPQRRDDMLAVSKLGDTLTINGLAFDFSELQDGGTILANEMPSDWIVGSVDKVAGELRVTILLPHGPVPSQAVAFPVDLITPPDGPLVIPS